MPEQVKQFVARRSRRAWMSFLATRVVGLAVDTCVMGIAYLTAFAIRLDFHEPSFGWRAVAVSFWMVWLVQIVCMIAAGCYRHAWRQIHPIHLPRYAIAAIVSCGILLALRIILPAMDWATIRPPYSITLLNMVFFAVGSVLVRLVWRAWMEARTQENLLLNRTEHLPSGDAVGMLRGKTVLVTGAGGSIGSELVRQAVQAGPARVLMVERGEHALYEIDREMRALGTTVPCIPLMLDITDETRMRALFAAWKPDVVLHAAAYKHVPMVEMNPREGLFNNTLATRHLGELAVEFGVSRFVLISTDKAVNPISVMGVTKRLAEVLLLDLNSPTGSSLLNVEPETLNLKPTIFSAVRFGNVLGSSGSVVPLFREQIAKGGPVTVTHPDMKRYFMTIPEAVSLVLQAAVLAKGGEIFTLDMGEPVRVLDLAEKMIQEAGRRPYVDIPIKFVGIRPGEKMFEELDISEKSMFKTGHARIFICKPRPADAAQIRSSVNDLLDSGLSSDDFRAKLLELKNV